MTEHVVELSWKNSLGREGIDSSNDSPLSRSLHKLLKGGRPFRRYSQILISKESSKVDAHKYLLGWLGVIVLSQANKVLFFPGFSKIGEAIKGLRGKHLNWDQRFKIDHISLEKNWNRWHLTSKDSVGHLGSINTSSLGEKRRLWFGLSVTSQSVFQPLFKRTSTVVSIPKCDVDRRMKIFEKSRENAKFHIVEPHPQAHAKFSEGFIHMSFIIGPKNFSLYRGENHGYPTDSPFLDKGLSSRITGMPVRLHRISLSDEVDIQITFFKMPGKLNVPALFSVN